MDMAKYSDTHMKNEKINYIDQWWSFGANKNELKHFLLYFMNKDIGFGQ